jgi:hypothetical protein
LLPSPLYFAKVSLVTIFLGQPAALRPGKTTSGAIDGC